VLPAQARLRRRPEFTAVVRSGRRAGRPTMVLHYLPERPVASDGVLSSAAARELATARPSSPRVGLVVGRAVGNSVVRHRVSRRLRAAAAEELHRLPPTADLVLRARPESATADFATLRTDLAAGLDRLLGAKAAR
jgi:ribonuclease P protein component